MTWRNLLENASFNVVLPWLGGTALYGVDRTWTIVGRPPVDHGWYTWRVRGREATVVAPADPETDLLIDRVRGYLVGNRLVVDGTSATTIRIDEISHCAAVVHLIPPGLDRFARAQIGRIAKSQSMRWIYVEPDVPLGPEDEVLTAFLEQHPNLDGIRGVPPGLDLAFRLEVLRREEAHRRRMEIARLQAELEAKRAEEERQRVEAERREQFIAQLGDGAGRRALAAVDFETAVREAARIGGATLLDHRPSTRRGEHVIRFRVDGQRFEAVCDTNLRIVDSGICLTDHNGTKGDTWLTVESLPSVIREAIRDDKLVVYRHA